MRKGKQELKKGFVAANCLGIALLVIDASLGGSYDMAAMNVLTLAGSLLALSRIRK
jgi:hypothetical protein